MTAPRFLAVAALCGTIACGGGEQQQEAERPALQAAAPDTTASGLWRHLEESSYTDWPMWPGKRALYEGTEPHGMRLTTYVNQLALDAITNKAGVMPAGAIVVKENYMPDSTLAAITIMYKAREYNAEYNDWFWVKRLADGTVEASGRVPMCQGCHAQSAANDYLITGSLSQ
jgi:hypothetical protein